MVQLLYVLKVKGNVSRTNDAFLIVLFHLWLRLKKHFGIGSDCLPHICTQIFGELCSVPSVSPSEVVVSCVCVCVFSNSPHLHHQYFFLAWD